MTAYVSRPQITLADHKVTTGDILDDIKAHHPDHPRLGAILRVVGNCGVTTRYFTRPLASPRRSGTAPVEERAKTAFADALGMAERAAVEAMDAAGLSPADVTGVVTSHSTGWSVPNLDVHLINRLGLKPTVRRLALTTLACAGGVQALVRACDMVAARPGDRILVVVSEVISSVYNHADTSIEAMIYKGLFGDSAGAVVVTGEPLGEGLAIDDTFEYVLPGSLDRYSGRLDGSGLHFDSTKKALTAADDVLPALLGWTGDSPADFALIHPGSPRIISDTATALGLAPHDSRHSTDTLAEEGNLGGVSVLRVLDRTHTDAPPAGAHGFAVAYGPGFATAALRVRWNS
jgi:predicted naringenin-chalcone synthase